MRQDQQPHPHLQGFPLDFSQLLLNARQLRAQRPLYSCASSTLVRSPVTLQWSVQPPLWDFLRDEQCSQPCWDGPSRLLGCPAAQPVARSQ